jgi:hypothetical protein
MASYLELRCEVSSDILAIELRTHFSGDKIREPEFARSGPHPPLNL